MILGWTEEGYFEEKAKNMKVFTVSDSWFCSLTGYLSVCVKKQNAEQLK